MIAIAVDGAYLIDVYDTVFTQLLKLTGSIGPVKAIPPTYLLWPQIDITLTGLVCWSGRNNEPYSISISGGIDEI